MKTVIITGGSSEIGEKIAEEFSKRKYNIILTYFQNLEKTMAISEKLPKAIIAIIATQNIDCIIFNRYFLFITI